MEVEGVGLCHLLGESSVLKPPSLGNLAHLQREGAALNAIS